MIYMIFYNSVLYRKDNKTGKSKMSHGAGNMFINILYEYIYSHDKMLFSYNLFFQMERNGKIIYSLIQAVYMPIIQDSQLPLHTSPQ